MAAKVPPLRSFDPRFLQQWSEQLRGSTDELDIEVTEAKSTATTATSKADTAQADIDAHEALTSAHGATGGVVGDEDFATTTEYGVVKQAGAVTDSSSSSVSVTSPDAATQTASYVQADVQSIATLANELKADVNQLKTDLNAAVTQLNALLAALRTSGSLET